MLVTALLCTVRSSSPGIASAPSNGGPSSEAITSTPRPSTWWIWLLLTSMRASKSPRTSRKIPLPSIAPESAVAAVPIVLFEMRPFTTGSGFVFTMLAPLDT
jgi:hypothetical protein